MNLSYLSKMTALLVLVSSSAMAKTINVQVSNLTEGQPFSHGILVAYDSSNSDVDPLFIPGKPDLGRGLADLSQYGNAEPLINYYSNVANAKEIDPVSIGQTSALYTISNVNVGDTLSYAAMLGITNDGFATLEGWTVPRENGVYMLPLEPWDDGTEGNNERFTGQVPGLSRIGMPAQAATGHPDVLPTQAEGFVHPHRGVLGSVSPGANSASDLDIAKQRFNDGQVGLITITVSE
ncbi:putative Spondin_N [Aeromonas salmonicida]|nr:putative Spondin_N [Aeromonas salmonicida]